MGGMALIWFVDLTLAELKCDTLWLEVCMHNAYRICRSTQMPSNEPNLPSARCLRCKFSKMNFFIFSLAQQIRVSPKMCLNQRLPRQIYSQFNAYSHTRFVRYSNKHCFARETNQQNRLSSIFFSFESLFALCVLTGNATINIGWNIHFSVKTNRLR